MNGFNNNPYSTYGDGIKTTEQWCEFIKAGRAKTVRPCANNTTARITAENLVAIKLHDTDIVTLFSDGRAILNSGGWLTSTTKERINRYTNAGIWQKSGIWYMRDGSLFYDGMVINADGTPKKPHATKQYEKRLALIKKQAKQYAHDFVEQLGAGMIPMPSNGDCWGCLFAGKNNSANKAQPMGTDHLKQHIKEKYYVPSLLVNAGREAGYQDFQIGMMGLGGHRLFINPEQNIYRYMVKHLQADLGKK